MEWWGWMILILGNTPLYLGIGWVIFSTWEEFFECVKFWFTPDIFSLFRGEWMADQAAEFKLLAWLALSGGCVALEYWLLTKYIL